jgi:hypothetical protein
MIRLKASVAVAISLLATPAVAETWRSQPTQKVACGGEATCQVMRLGASYNRVDSTKNLYSRCDDKGCDTYQAKMSRSGAVIDIEVPGKGLLARMMTNGITSGMSYLEAFTFLETVFVVHGVCTPE